MDAGGVNAERLGHQTQLQAVVEVYSVAHRNVERLPSRPLQIFEQGVGKLPLPE